METKRIFLSYSQESLADFRKFFYNDVKTILDCHIDSYENSVGINWSYELENVLSKTDLVIAVLDKADSNVYYEIGLAQGMGKSILLIVQNEDEIPTNLINHRCLFWSNRYKEKILDEIFVVLFKSQVKKESFKFDLKLLLEKNINNAFINKIDSIDFENLIFKVFRRCGFEPKINTSASEKGYDILLNNYNDEKALVECKRYDLNKKVSIQTVIELLEVLVFHNINHGFVITTSNFTESALGFVKELKDVKIELWDLDKLRIETSNRGRHFEF